MKKTFASRHRAAGNIGYPCIPLAPALLGTTAVILQ